MAGPFPLLTDEHISKALVKALRERGWDVARAVEIFGQETDDDALFEYAAQQKRVLVTSDEDFEVIANCWLGEWRRFTGLVIWKEGRRQAMSVGDFLRAFEKLAARSDDFGEYPIFHVKPEP